MTTRTNARSALIARARQHDGVFTTSDAHECGVTQRALRCLVERGEIVRVHRGVYRFTHVPVTPVIQLRAAPAAASGNAVAPHSSAATLLKLNDVPVGTPEITVVSRDVNLRKLHRVRVHTSRDLPDRDRTRVRGIPCTTGSRTLIDLYPTSPEAVNIHRADHAIGAGITTRTTLHARATALKSGRKGVQKLAEVTAPGADGTFWSALERAFARHIRRSGLPNPEYNAAIDIAGRRYYADAMWRSRELVAELHGLGFHRLPPDRARDDERLNAFTRAGLRTLVFRWWQVMYEFDTVACAIREALVGG
jgi:very-short-patch-repair endonuclease